jgi:hypothetical protein
MRGREELAAAIAAEQRDMAQRKRRALRRNCDAFGYDERHIQRMLDAIGLHEQAAAMGDAIAALAERYGRAA